MQKGFSVFASNGFNLKGIHPYRSVLLLKNQVLPFGQQERLSRAWTARNQQRWCGRRSGYHIIQTIYILRTTYGSQDETIEKRAEFEEQIRNWHKEHLPCLLEA